MTINGEAMDMDRINERLRLGDTEIWDLRNGDASGGGMMGGMMNQPHTASMSTLSSFGYWTSTGTHRLPVCPDGRTPSSSGRETG